MTEMTLGQRIAARRKMLSLSQEAFGEKMGVSRQAAFKWESDASVPEVDKLINMSRLFGVSVGWLLGEEPQEQATAEDAEKLSEQILFTFQPPEPPDAPAKVEEPVYAPIPEEPKKKPSKPWLAIVCAVVASVSLILSVISYGLLSKKLRQVTEENASLNAALQEQIGGYDSQLTELEDYFITLNKRFEELNGDRMFDSFELDVLSAKLTELLKALGGGTELPDDNQSLPKYDELESWSLTAEPGQDMTAAKLQLKATAAVDISGAILLVSPEGELGVALRHMSLPCTVSGREISLEFDAPLNGAYRYVLDLSMTNGDRKQIKLEGHGLTDLAALSQPTVRSTPKTVHVFSDKLYFSQGWFNIYLAVPYLMPKDANHVWGTPKICYYQNGELVEENIQHGGFRESKRSDNSLNFEVLTENYEMSRFMENDIHELRLEGTLTINGTDREYSILLRKWEIRQGEFVSLMD